MSKTTYRDLNRSKYYSEITPENKFSLNLKELFEYRELLYFFSWRDIKVKYKQTVLGFLWAILQPFMMMLVLTIFVKRAFNISSGEIPYPIFAFSGFLLWTLFSSGITNASNSMVQNVAIIQKIYFPRIIIPISSIIVSVFDFFMGFIAFVLLLIFFKQPIDIFRVCLYWPAGLIMAVVSALGPSCLFSAMNIKYRDFRYVVPFMIQLLLFLTPVMYPISITKYVWAKYVIALNPMYASMAFFRFPLTTVDLDWQLMSTSIASGFIFLCIGFIYFKRTEIYFSDLA